jgi:alanine racemase
MPSFPPELAPQTRVIVDLGAVAHNFRALRSLASPATKFMAVVKADAYGHGAVQIARTLIENGSDFLAVARISEAVELREEGIDAPLLLFGDVLPSQIPYLAAHDIRVTLTCLENALALAPIAKTLALPLKVHIKVDTGMGRLGILHDQFAGPSINQIAGSSINKNVGPDKSEDRGANRPLRCVDKILAIQNIRGIELEGIYTHLANADASDKTHTKDQLSRFKLLVQELKAKGVTPIIHAANSAALIEMPDSHFNMVRPGIAIYGLWPSDAMDKTRVCLKQAMSIRSKIIHLKNVPKGFTISYGSTHVTRTATRIATIPIGYADGYSRLLSSRGEMIVRGKKAPILGRVCMDFTMIDVGHIPGAALGDEVIILGSQGEEKITATQIAAAIGTINYEVVASLTKRMPIRYIFPWGK